MIKPLTAGYFVCLLLFPLLFGGSASLAPRLPGRADALLAAVMIGAPQTQAGARQTLQMRLTAVAGPEISFRLKLTYPSGVMQEVTDAGVGVARYELYAIDCGCGNPTLARPTSSNVEKVLGEFQID
jgi:hypothetical protein